jgi:uncharacterized protein (TIGR03435 family)
MSECAGFPSARVSVLAITLVGLTFASLTTSGQVGAAPSGNASQSIDRPAKLPEFEVASIRPSERNTSTPVGLFVYPGGEVSVRGLPLEDLIFYAFNVQEWQVSGGPAWMREKDEAYDVDAKPPADSISAKSAPASIKNPPSDEQRQMLQALLMERFQLKVHRETKAGLVYALVKSGKPLGLQVPKNTNDYPWAGSVGGGAPFAHGIQGRNISMTGLAQRLSGVLERTVVDQTGLTGTFDFRYENPSADRDTVDFSTAFDSLQGIGLKLNETKGQVETIVVDHLEKPTAN